MFYSFTFYFFEFRSLASGILAGFNLLQELLSLNSLFSPPMSPSPPQCLRSPAHPLDASSQGYAMLHHTGECNYIVPCAFLLQTTRAKKEKDLYVFFNFPGLSWSMLSRGILLSPVTYGTVPENVYWILVSFSWSKFGLLFSHLYADFCIRFSHFVQHNTFELLSLHSSRSFSFPFLFHSITFILCMFGSPGLGFRT